MKCIECKSEQNEYNERLGEITCSDCGFVHIENMPEETVSGYGHQDFYVRNGDRGVLGSIFSLSDMKHQKNKSLMRNLYRTAKFSRSEESMKKGITICNMVLSYHQPSPALKELVASNYKRIYKSGQMRGIILEVRAVAVVFYTLRELGVSVLLKDIAKRNNVSPKRASKVSKRVARILGKPWVLHQINTDGWITVTCQSLEADSRVATLSDFTSDAKRVARYLKTFMDRRDLTFTRVNLATSIYIASIFRRQIGLSNYSQIEVAKAAGVVDTSVRLGLRNFLKMNGMTKSEMLQMPMEMFLEGIRYE
jgi:transcription initiation factor TFIIIB Brf1 subunit/transcription initiation factor TFIIB